MVLLLLLCALLLPCWAAYGWVAKAIDLTAGKWSGRLLCASLSMGLGLGTATCTHYLWLEFIGPPGWLYVNVESVGWLLLGLAGHRNLRGSEFIASPHLSCQPQFKQTPNCGRLRTVLLASTCVVALFALAGIIAGHITEPYGCGDSLGIWNPRALFLFRGGEHWRDGLTDLSYHPDYPLLVPTANARLWTWLGYDPTWVPFLIQAMYVAGTATLVGSALARIRSTCQGLLATLIILGNVRLLQLGVSQYAESSLQYYFIATVVLIGIHDADRSRRRSLLVLAGAMAALAAWTKNEGLLFLVILAVARSITVARQMGWRNLGGELKYLIVGAGPVLLVLAEFKATTPVVNDLVQGQNWRDTLARVADFSRISLILKTWGEQLVRCLKWSLLVLPLVAWLLGRAGQIPPQAAGLPTARLIMGLTFVGYFVVHLTSPHDLHWHVATSVDRLLMQLFPIGVWILFTAISTPEEVLADSRGCQEVPKPKQGSLAA